MAIDDGCIVEESAFRFPSSVFDAAGGSVEGGLANGGFSEGYRHLAEVDAREITYMSDGLRIKGFRVAPRGDGPFPCVIVNRGGNRDFSAIGPLVVVNLLCRIASWGYLVVASQYRGGGGSEGKDEFGGADMADVMNLFSLLDRDPAADPDRIGMYGGSRGGMMTYLALARTDRVRAAVIRCGVSDLTNWTEDRKDMEAVYRDLIPGFGTDSENALKIRSAVHWPEKLCRTTPILIMQGAADWRVNPLSALRMGEALFRERHPFRLVMIEGADHAMTECIPERNRLTRDWFDRFVMRKEAPPSTEPHGD